MSLTIRVCVLTEENADVSSGEDAIHACAEELNEVATVVARRIPGIEWSERRMPWGTRPYHCHRTTQECTAAMHLFEEHFGNFEIFGDEAEATCSVLSYATQYARLNRYRYDAAPYGYAVPVAFDGFAGEVGPFSDAFVVSAFQLARECENLIARTNPSLDAREKASAFCSVLLEAARHSIRSGCAVVFTA